MVYWTALRAFLSTPSSSTAPPAAPAAPPTTAPGGPPTTAPAAAPLSPPVAARSSVELPQAATSRSATSESPILDIPLSCSGGDGKVAGCKPQRQGLGLLHRQTHGLLAGSR